MAEKASASAEFYVCEIKPMEHYIGACDRWLLTDWIGFSINPPVQTYQGSIFNSAYQAQANEYEQCMSGRYVTADPHEDEMRVAVATRLNAGAVSHESDDKLRSNLRVSFSEANPGSSCSPLPWQYFATIEQQITLFAPNTTINGVRNYRHLVSIPGSQPDPKTGVYVVGEQNTDPAQVLPTLEVTAEAIARVFYTVTPITPLPDDLDPARITGPMPEQLNANVADTMTDALVIYHAMEYTPPSGTIYSTGVQSWAFGNVNDTSGFITLTDEQFEPGIIWGIMFGNPGHGPGIRGPIEANRYVSGQHRIRHIVLGIGVTNGRSFPDDSYFAAAMEEGHLFNISTSIGYTPGATEGASSYTVDYTVVDVFGDKIPYRILEAKFISPVGLFIRVDLVNPFPVPVQIVVRMHMGARAVFNLDAESSKQVVFAVFGKENSGPPTYSSDSREVVYDDATSVMVGNWTYPVSAINWCVLVDPANSGLPGSDEMLPPSNTTEYMFHESMIAVNWNTQVPGGGRLLEGTNRFDWVVNPFSATVVPIPSVEAPALANPGYEEWVWYSNTGVWAVVKLLYEGTIEGVPYSGYWYHLVVKPVGEVMPGDHEVAQADIVHITAYGGSTTGVAAKGTASHPEATLSDMLKSEAESLYPFYYPPGGGGTGIPCVDSQVEFGPFIEIDILSCVPDSTEGRSAFDGTDPARYYMRPLMGIDTSSAIPTSTLKFYAGTAT